MSDRYQLIATPILHVHFEKGHMISATRFDPETRDRVFPMRLTQLAQGYASLNAIVINNERFTWIDRINRGVWHCLAPDLEDVRIAHADEVRPILVHQEHHQEIGQYSCDCQIVLENPEARYEQHVWRVES